MFVFIRAVTYAALFIGLVLVFLPAQLVTPPGLARPESVGASQVAGLIVAASGGALALWCVLTFALVGRGTPAPFDPPRRLVVRGPYAVVRNPMYIGAGLALGGASLFYQSLPLLAYAAGFFLVTHFFVVLYEEPTLQRTFGKDYESYCRQVRRWTPRPSVNALAGQSFRRDGPDRDGSSRAVTRPCLCCPSSVGPGAVDRTTRLRRQHRCR